MQNQQTQQDLPNNTQPFFTTGQGTNSPNVNQFESENNLNTSNPDIDWRQRRDETPSQIAGAAIEGAATGASQVESTIPGAQEPLDVQTLPNAIDNATRESALNLEIGGMNTEAANIIPFPSQNLPTQGSDNAPDNQTSTDSAYKISPPSGRRDTLSQEAVGTIKNLMKKAEIPDQFYDELTETRAGYLEEIRNTRAA